MLCKVQYSTESRHLQELFYAYDHLVSIIVPSCGGIPSFFRGRSSPSIEVGNPSAGDIHHEQYLLDWRGEHNEAARVHVIIKKLDPVDFRVHSGGRRRHTLC